MKPHIADFLKFLESKGEKRVPIKVRLLHPNKFSPITKEDLYVKGYLDLTHTEIEFLPDNLIVEDTLYLSGSKIKSLSDNLTVGGSLYCRNSKIESIPNNLKVGESLYIAATPLARRMTREEIKQEITNRGGYVKGYIYL